MICIQVCIIVYTLYICIGAHLYICSTFSICIHISFIFRCNLRRGFLSRSIAIAEWETKSFGRFNEQTQSPEELQYERFARGLHSGLWNRDAVQGALWFESDQRIVRTTVHNNNWYFVEAENNYLRFWEHDVQVQQPAESNRYLLQSVPSVLDGIRAACTPYVAIHQQAILRT